MNLRLTALLAIAGGIVFAGCATAPTQSIVASRGALLASTPVRVDAMPFTPLRLDESADSALSAQAAVIHDGTRPTFARGFRLPEVDGPLVITVRSLRFVANTDAAIVYPTVQFLDASYNVIGRIAPERFVYRRMSDGMGLTAEGFVDRKDGARYVLVTERSVTEAEYTVTQTNTMGQIPLVIPVGGGALMWFIPTGSSAPEIRLVASPVGRIDLAVSAYKVERVQPPVDSSDRK